MRVLMNIYRPPFTVRRHGDAVAVDGRLWTADDQWSSP